METNTPTFQDVIMNLERYWANQGCVVLQPYDNEVGAGTFHTATTLRSLGPGVWRTAYVQPSRRPTDGRYGENPNRLQPYYQSQVILKPSPDNVQQLYLAALGASVGKFGSTAWKSPSSRTSSRSVDSSAIQFLLKSRTVSSA